tara:strand:+ start:601 stop:1068 length:468 start_codon:yes stop_codon:yes gene_type:complete
MKMKELILLKHIQGAPGLRLIGLGPNMQPCNGLKKLQKLFNQNARWAQNRSISDLRNCLSKSDVIVSLWIDKKIVGFGRALSDGIFRSVLWDIVIDQNYQGKGYGKIIVNALLESKKIKNTKKIYLMTTNKKDFYTQLDFKEVDSQKLLVKVSEF